MLPLTKRVENNFKLGIYLVNESDSNISSETITERIFCADQYSPAVRSNVDIKSYYTTILKGINKVFGRDSYNHNINGYNVLSRYEKAEALYGNEYNYGNSKLYRPSIKNIFIDDKMNVGSKIEISGTPIKIGLYLNDAPIIERIIYTRKYNPSVRFSKELYDFVLDTVSDISEDLRAKDIIYQFNEQYNQSNKGTLIPTQIGEFSREKRLELLNKVY
jgi:hypothetical protein